MGGNTGQLNSFKGKKKPRNSTYYNNNVQCLQEIYFRSEMDAAAARGDLRKCHNYFYIHSWVTKVSLTSHCCTKIQRRQFIYIYIVHIHVYYTYMYIGKVLKIYQTWHNSLTHQKYVLVLGKRNSAWLIIYYIYSLFISI